MSAKKNLLPALRMIEKPSHAQAKILAAFGSEPARGVLSKIKR
jgi:hypothetical protein